MFDHLRLTQTTSIFLRIKKKALNSVFKALYFMLKDHHQPLLFSFMFCLISFLQLMHLNFGNDISYVWKDDQIPQGIDSVVKYFTISIHLKEKGLQVYLGMFYIFFILTIFTYTIIILFAASTKQPSTIIILFIRIIITFFLQIGFIPILLLFFGLLSCGTSKESNISVWKYNSEYECWGQELYIHQILAIIAIVLFQLLVSFLSLLFFESKYSYQDANAQRSGRPYSQYHINVLLIVMAYQLLDIPRFSALFLAISFVASFFFFYFIHYQKPFYNNIIQKLWSLISALQLWVNILQTFAFLLEGQYFINTIYGLIGGIPLIILIILQERTYEIDLISVNINKFIKGISVIQLCDYLLRLLDKGDENSNLMLEGFLEIHKQTCLRIDCILKSKKSQNHLLKKKTVQIDYTKNQLIIDLINQIYNDSIKSYPQDIYLRINYSYFLIDRLNNKQQALTELQQAELSDPTFDYQFIIYRYQKIMEDDIQEQQQLDQVTTLDLVTEMAFETLSKQLIFQIEKNSLLYIDFWKQLLEETPDLGKLHLIGVKINHLNYQIEKSWQHLRRLNSKVTKLNRLMSKYFLKIQNDEEKGNKLLSQCVSDQNEQKLVQELQDISLSSIPVIWISGEIEKLGYIINCNKAVSSLIGYLKSDLQNRKINLIQPDIFSNLHDHFLENFIEKNQENNFQSLLKQKIIYVKTKCGFIIPCTLNIKVIQMANTEITLCGFIQQDVQIKNQCIFICNSQGFIENMNSNSIKIFDFGFQTLNQKQINIVDIFPDILERKNELMQKNGGLVSFQCKTNSSKHTISISQKDLDLNESWFSDIKQKSNQIQFKCILSEITFTCIEEIAQKVFGYIVKIERQEKFTQGNQLEKKQIAKKLCQLQFKFNYNEGGYQQELVNDYNSNNISAQVDQSILCEDQTKISQQIFGDISQQNIINNINYGEGIRIVRLQIDKIIEIEDIISEEEVEESQKEISEKQSEKKEQSQYQIITDMIQIYKSKKLFEITIKQSKIPKTTSNFRLLINIISLLLNVLVFVEFFLNKSKISLLQDSLDLITYSNFRGALCMGIQSSLQDLKYLNLDYVPLLLQQYNSSDLENQYRESLNNWIQGLTDIQNILLLANTNLNSKYEQYFTFYVSQNIQMLNYNGGIQNFTYNEAIESIIAKAISLNGSNLNQFINSNEDLFYIEYNTFHEITNNFFPILEFYAGNIYSNVEDLQFNVMIVLVISSIIIFLLTILFIFLLIKIEVVNITALKLFLDINERIIKQLNERCENFITSLQVGEDEDDIVSEYEEMIFEQDIIKDESDSLLGDKIKKKRYSNSNIAYKGQLLKFIAVAMVSVIYFIYIYVQTYQLTNFSNDIIPLMNVTSFVEAYYRLSDNGLRKALEDENYTFITDEFDSQNFVEFIVSEIQNLDAEVHQVHSQLSSDLDQSYQDIFNQLFIKNACTSILQFDSNITENECNEYNDGVLTLGLSIGMTKFFETFRSLANSFENYKSTQNYSLQYNISNQNRLNYMLNLINANDPQNMRTMQEKYIRLSYNYLIEQLLIMKNDNFINFQNQKVQLFLAFEVYEFVAFFLLWVPMVYNAIKEMKNIRQIFTLIPWYVIQQTSTIRVYLRKILKI